MLYPQRGGRRHGAMWTTALAAGFTVMSFVVGSALIGRPASPLGLLVAALAGVGYAFGVRALLARELAVRLLWARAVTTRARGRARRS